MRENSESTAMLKIIKSAKFLSALRFEGISLLALTFALCLTNGYVYLEVLNDRLGVPVARLGFDSYAYAVYGGVNILVIFTALLIALAMVAATTTIMFLIENKRDLKIAPDLNSRRSRLASAIRGRLIKSWESILVTIIATFVALIFWTVWKLTVSESVERAELAAFKEITEYKAAIVKLKNMDDLRGCIVGESNDMLYLVSKDRSSNNDVDFHKIIVAKNSILTTDTSARLVKSK